MNITRIAPTFALIVNFVLCWKTLCFDSGFCAEKAPSLTPRLGADCELLNTRPSGLTTIQHSTAACLGLGSAQWAPRNKIAIRQIAMGNLSAP